MLGAECPQAATGMGVGDSPPGPGGPTWGTEAAINAMVLAELGALGVGAGVGAGRATLLVLHVEGAGPSYRDGTVLGPQKVTQEPR